MYGTPIIQKSTYANLPALSTTEAEYSALTEAAKEALYLWKLLQSLVIDLYTSPLFTDNHATHPTQHQRTQHYNTKMHFIRFHLQQKHLSVQYIPGKE
jgi:hypothetical protein